jgi:hypothetical protein
MRRNNLACGHLKNGGSGDDLLAATDLLIVVVGKIPVLQDLRRRILLLCEKLGCLDLQAGLSYITVAGYERNSLFTAFADVNPDAPPPPADLIEAVGHEACMNACKKTEAILGQQVDDLRGLAFTVLQLQLAA